MTRDEQSGMAGGASGAADGAAARIEALLARQLELFAGLDALSERQSELIAGDEADGLLELLSERQRLIDGIAQANALLEPFRSRWSDVMESLGQAERDRVRRRLDELSGLTARIAQRDENDRQQLERRRDAVAAELAQVHRGRGALAAYGGKAEGGARFHDREA
jgi:hypothetical protein